VLERRDGWLRLATAAGGGWVEAGSVGIVD
jgi:hypothetical protein